MRGHPGEGGDRSGAADVRRGRWPSAGGRGPAPRCTPTGSTPTTRYSACSSLIGMAGVIVMAASVDKLDRPARAGGSCSATSLLRVVLRRRLSAGLAAPPGDPADDPAVPVRARRRRRLLAGVLDGTGPGPVRAVGRRRRVDLLGPTLAARLGRHPAAHGASARAVRALRHPGARRVGRRHRAPGCTMAAGRPAWSSRPWLAFVLTAALWWSYFDLSGGAAKRRLVQEGDERTRQGVHDFYVYAHLPVAVSLAAVAVGLEHAIAARRRRPSLHRHPRRCSASASPATCSVPR